MARDPDGPPLLANDASWVHADESDGPGSDEHGHSSNDGEFEVHALSSSPSLSVSSSEAEDEDESGTAPAAGQRRPHTTTAARARQLPEQDGDSSAEPQFVMPSMTVSSVSSPSARRRRAEQDGAAATASSSSARALHHSYSRPPAKKRHDASASAPSASTTTPPSQRRRGKLSSSSSASRPRPRHGSSLSEHLVRLLTPILEYTLSLAGLAFAYIKPVLALVSALWLLLGLARLLLLTPWTRTALLPLCSLPGASYLHLPFCALRTPVPPLEFSDLVTVQSSLADVLDASAAGAALPLDMKRGEASIRDVRTAVEYSQLPSRHELVDEFGAFVDAARSAAHDLTTFNARIGRAVDAVLATNRWTLQVLDGVAEREAARGAVARVLARSLLFAPFASPKLTSTLLLDQYLAHAVAVEDQLAALILDAHALLALLGALDDRLDTIGAVAVRDGLQVREARDELLAHIWTWLGGNRAGIRKHKEQLAVLAHVGTVRKAAWRHVSATLLKLQEIAAGLEDLRERVAAPAMGSLAGGDGQAQVPLQVHIEHIARGVERLEEQRKSARAVGEGKYRAVLDGNDKGKGGEGRMIEGRA